jgi:hypothetical protein
MMLATMRLPQRRPMMSPSAPNSNIPAGSMLQSVMC